MAGSALVEMIIATTGVRDGFRWMSTQVSDTSETWVLVQPLMRRLMTTTVLLQEKARGSLTIITLSALAQRLLALMCLAGQDPNGSECKPQGRKNLVALCCQTL